MRKTSVVALLVGVCGISFSFNPSTLAMPASCINATKAVTGNAGENAVRIPTEAETPLRLFEGARMSGSVKISENGTSSNGTHIEQKLLTDYSKHGLQTLIASDGGPEKIIKTLIRLGLVNQGATDPFYVPMKLASANTPVDLSKPHSDKDVEEYIKAKKFAKQAARLNKPAYLPKATGHRRNEFLYWQTLKALDRVDDSDNGSRDAVIAAFTEIARIDDSTIPMKPDEKSAKIDKILNGLRAEVSVRPANYQINDAVEQWIGVIPVAGPWILTSASSLVRMYNQIVLKDRDLKTTVVDAGNLPHQKRSAVIGFFLDDSADEQIPGTYKIGFFERDPMDYQAASNDFIKKYLDPSAKPDLFTTEFANDLEKAYPELHDIRNQPGLGENNIGIVGNYVDKGPFGPGTYEGYTVMTRAALTVAIVRGERRYFPEMTGDEFATLRKQFMRDLKLDDGGKISSDGVNQYLVFLMLDTLGRGRNPFLDSMNKQYGLQETSSYERRSDVLLRKYRLASRSFSRLPDDAQENILKWFDSIYYYNTGEIIELEGGRTSFDHFMSSSEDDLAALYYRSLLSFAALPASGSDAFSSSTLSSATFKKWTAFRSAMFSLNRENAKPEDVYDQYMTWLAKELNLPLSLNNAKQVTLVRLAAQAHAATPAQAQQVASEFEGLNPEEQNLIVKYMTRYPTLNFGLSDVFVQVQQHPTKATAYEGKPYLLAMKLLAHAYSRIDQTEQSTGYLAAADGRARSVDFRFVVNSLNNQDASDLLGNNGLMAVLQGGYIVRPVR